MPLVNISYKYVYELIPRKTLLSCVLKERKTNIAFVFFISNHRNGLVPFPFLTVIHVFNDSCFQRG